MRKNMDREYITIILQYYWIQTSMEELERHKTEILNAEMRGTLKRDFYDLFQSDDANRQACWQKLFYDGLDMDEEMQKATASQTPKDLYDLLLHALPAEAKEMDAAMISTQLPVLMEMMVAEYMERHNNSAIWGKVLPLLEQEVRDRV